MTVFGDDRVEPFGGERPWLNVLVLACVPDMLHEAHVVGDVGKDRDHSGITVFGGDLFLVSAELNETLHDNLNHRIAETRTGSFGHIL